MPTWQSAFSPSHSVPKLIQGKAIVGVCLIRLKHVRPDILPAWTGFASENGAHRIAVEWERDGSTQEGVFIPRRDTSSRLNALVGGRIFPGRHEKARFDVHEGNGAYSVAFKSNDGTSLSIEAEDTPTWSMTSVFPDLATASEFMRRGACGYSTTQQEGRFHGLELRARRWQIAPLEVKALRSSFFEDRSIFPEGSVQFDSAMVMKDIPHEGRSLATLNVT